MRDRRTRKAGFTLVELIVVVGIIGILASIGLAVFARYKSEAVDAQMESALASGRNAMEAFYEGNDYTYVGATVGGLGAFGFRATEGVLFLIESATPTGYALRACTMGGTSPSFVFDTVVGSTVADGTAC